MQRDDLAYAGFWLRVWAAVIDGVLIGIIVCPILIAIYGLAYFDSGRIGHDPFAPPSTAKSEQKTEAQPDNYMAAYAKRSAEELFGPAPPSQRPSVPKGFIAGPADFLLTWIFPAVAIILFWIKKQATPGKMAISARIVDAKTGNNASVGQLIGRYFAYFLSALPLGLGMIWIAFDKRKQGWHDKLAGTVVIRSKARGAQNVETTSTIQRSAITPGSTTPQKDKLTLPEADSGEEDFYAQAFKELESENKKVGLWAKSFSEAQGNESLAKANYLKIRSGQLANEHKQALLEEERQRQAAEKITEMESAQTFTSPTLGAKFILIPSGTFMMGSPAGEEGRGNDETQHQVTISKPFYMQITSVTQGQWKKVMGNNPSHFSSCGDDFPVENVSWNDVQEFIGMLNRQEGTDKYRLPTEAQWEYACRAGSITAYCFADDPGRLAEYAFYDGNLGGETHPVGWKKPNAWGLYDMHGNVREWVQDWEGDYPAGSATDPEGPAAGSHRVVRGGSWYGDAWVCRSAARFDLAPGSRDNSLGVRLLMTR